MDPLSVTLVVVSLTTAVKDLVELGQKIHESFNKVSNNLRNARRVAEDIKEMVEEIRIFCEDNKDALEKMKDFRLALQRLLDKFRSFETSILPLLPQTSVRRQDRFIRGWDAWRNNNKIEGSIVDLQNNIVKVMRQHMMKSAMRIELKLETVHQDTSRGLTGITQGLEVLEVVRRDVSAIRTAAAAATTPIDYSHESSGTTSDEFNRNVIMFAKSTPSTSAPMLRTPNVITEELMTAAYIKLQINSIAMAVEEMSTLPRASTANSVNKFQLSLMLEQGSMNITYLRHHIVRRVTHIRDCLDAERIHAVSIYDGAHALNELSVGLETLGMLPESILVGEWAVRLARSLVNADTGGQPDLGAALARYLLSQSVQYDVNGDKIRSINAIKDAYPITQHLRHEYGGEAHFLILHSRIILQYAQLVENPRSIEMTIEGIQILEGILNVQAFTRSQLHGNVEQVVQPSSSFFDRIFSSAQPITAITCYAYALQYLGTHLFIGGRPECALDLVLLAIAVHRKIVSIHGSEHKVDLAMALSSFVKDRGAGSISAGELIAMADECIQLLRELALKNPVFYARELVYVLWQKARTLQTLDRDAEAIATWEEVASLAGQIVQDSELCATALGNLSNQFRRLNRHDDAARTGKLAMTTYREKVDTQASRYFYLSKDLLHLRRYKESAEAARISVGMYRRLAMRDSDRKWVISLTKGFSNLAHCLVALGEYSKALIAWKESMSVMDNFLNAHPGASSAVIHKYLAVLDKHTSISYILEEEEECLALCSTTIEYLRRLSEVYPQNTDVNLSLLRTDFCYTYNMLRLGRLQDAEQYIDHWPDTWNSKLKAISESRFAEWHAAMVILKANVLDAQGCTEQAVLTSQKVPVILRLPGRAHRRSFDLMVESLIHEARLRVDLDDIEGAMQVAEEALRLSRDNKPERNVDSLLWSLHGIAFTALSSRNYERAIEAAREGCEIYARPEEAKRWQHEHNEHTIFMRPSLYAILSSAEANLGSRSSAIEYARRAVDASLEISDMKLYISTTTAEQSYMETYGNMANILVITGDMARARDICEERRTYFSEKVETRMGDYRELAPILRMLGVICCSQGRHEEGDAAVKELSRIVRMLGSAFPSLQEQVKIRLRNQALIPILKVLEDLSKKLDCGHQTEIASLFEI